MAQVNVINQAGKASGNVELPDAVFARAENGALLHEVITRQLASLRQGTHATKTRSEVSGGGKKPWKQKGTGRARVGSIRSPLWKGGGTIFGPTPRSHSYRMPRKKVRAALHVALSDALREGKLICVSDLELSAPRTREFAKIARQLDATNGALYVVKEIGENLGLASRNVSGVGVIEAHDLTPYDVVVARRLVFSKDAITALGETEVARVEGLKAAPVQKVTAKAPAKKAAPAKEVAPAKAKAPAKKAAPAKAKAPAKKAAPAKAKAPAKKAAPAKAKAPAKKAAPAKAKAKAPTKKKDSGDES